MVTPVNRPARSVVSIVGNTSPAALVAVHPGVKTCGSNAGSSCGASMLKETLSPEQAAAGAVSQLTAPGTGSVNTSNVARVEVWQPAASTTESPTVPSLAALPSDSDKLTPGVPCPCKMNADKSPSSQLYAMPPFSLTSKAASSSRLPSSQNIRSPSKGDSTGLAAMFSPTVSVFTHVPAEPVVMASTVTSMAPASPVFKGRLVPVPAGSNPLPRSTSHAKVRVASSHRNAVRPGPDTSNSTSASAHNTSGRANSNSATGVTVTGNASGALVHISVSPATS